MKYPRFLQEGDCVGITALSKGAGNKLLKVKKSLCYLKKDYRLMITPNVYGDDIVSSSIETRIREFNDLLNEDINGLITARGGDFAYEVINELDLEKVKEKKLLVEGFSDNSLLVYPLTTKYDLATVYGANSSFFDDDELAQYKLNNLEFLKGNLVTQKSYPDGNTSSINGDFESRGVIIGGCLDAIRFLFGTDLDGTKEFIEKYKNKKIIWYFDIYALNSVDTYLTLLQMKNMGYFKYSDTFLFSSVPYPRVDCLLEYHDAYKKALGDANIILNANVGHNEPRFTILNGSLATVTFRDNELILKQELMNENNG